jgi:hypothetical protein
MAAVMDFSPRLKQQKTSLSRVEILLNFINYKHFKLDFTPNCKLIYAASSVE